MIKQLLNKYKILVPILIVLQISSIAGCKNNDDVKTIKISPSKDSKITLTLYFPDKESGTLIMEEREVKIATELYSNLVINELLKGSSEGKTFFPEGTKLLGSQQTGGTLHINFSKEFETGIIKEGYPPELILKAIVNSLTESDTIKSVKLLCEGRALKTFKDIDISEPLKRDNDAAIIKTNTDSKNSKLKVKLYFPDTEKSSYEFATEIREIKVEDLAVAKAIVNELLKGSQKYGKIIPTGTRLLSINLKDSLIIVDFSEEFITNSNLGSGYETMMIYSIVNSLTELDNISKVQFLIAGEVRKTSKHIALDKPFTKNLNPIGNSDESNPESDVVIAIAQKVLNAIAQKEMVTLASYVHPTKGVRITPYAFVNTESDQVFSSTKIKTILNNPTKYKFGAYDGKGDDIILTFKEYYNKFIYDHDFINAPDIGYNERIGVGNSLNNIPDAYPDGKFVEYHFSGFDAQYEGMDWSSLRLVFEKNNGSWYLVGIVHDQWTI